MPEPLDLSPARWVWLPSQRTLPNTFVLFRRKFDLAALPSSAAGWIVADSRYRLWVNGERVQWGPAPHDPRHAEADPVDLLPFLRVGENVVAVEVLFYGHGDGTSPFGKPGLLARFDLDGRVIGTDSDWRCEVDRAHRAGQPKRWYLRALQEEFDARLRSEGWDLPGFDDSGWLPAAELANRADRPSFASGYPDYLHDTVVQDPAGCRLSARSIPLLEERFEPARPLTRGRVVWHRRTEDWFDFRVPGSFEIPQVERAPAGSQTVSAQGDGEGTYLTFEMARGVVGFPGFVIDAPAGTVVEAIVHEVHDPEGHPWLDSHFYGWSLFVCREGLNRFETFDYEALKFLQLHIHGNERPATVFEVGVRIRAYPRPPAEFEVSEPGLQRLFEANVQTLANSCQDIVVDGMGRERQQYSGDCGHQLQGWRLATGDADLSERFLRTYARGQMPDGVYLDSWPAWDRLARLWEKAVGASYWGSLLDHSVGFCFDHFHFWMQTGRTEAVRSNWAGLMRFVEYLRSIVRDGLLPVEGIHPHAVWIDHEAFERPVHRQCAFNLYASAMLTHAMAPMAAAFDPGREAELRSFGAALLAASESAFWDPGRRAFVNNRPFGEDRLRMDDRSLATASLYGMADDVSAMVELLADPTDEVGLSYPANVAWNHWALIEHGRIQAVIDDLRRRWSPMTSVLENETVQEFWTVHRDRPNLMSHCASAPLLSLYQGLLGLRPTAPGYGALELRPQLGDLERVRVSALIPAGRVKMEADRDEVRLRVPDGVRARVRWGGSEFDLAKGEWIGRR